MAIDSGGSLSKRSHESFDVGSLMPPLEKGAIVEGFLLEKRLHQGGMASMWSVSRVDAEGNPAPVAGEPPLIMKVPRIKGGEDPATIVGYEVEQMIMPALTGIHVPRYIARGDFTRQPFIVMEHIAGDTLRPAPGGRARWRWTRWWRSASRSPPRCTTCTASTWCIWTSSPATSCSARTAKRCWSITACRATTICPTCSRKNSRCPMGTGPYMSPEQVQFVRNDPRSDLFALGVMLYHLTTGERPFGAPDLGTRPAQAPVARPRAAARAAPGTARPGCRKSS